MSPLRPYDLQAGTADDVRCPRCNKLHATRAPNTLVTLRVIARETRIDRGIVLKCRCGSYLQEIQQLR